MPLRIELVGRDDKEVLENLLQFYLHEKCKYEPIHLLETGRFQYEDIENYFSVAGHTPYFIRVRGRLAGFVLIKQIESHTKKPCFAIAEFFVLEPYRKLGIGEEIARSIFNTHNGAWQIHIHSDNKAGREFMNKVLYRYTANRFQITALPGVNGPVYTFSSPGPTVTGSDIQSVPVQNHQIKPETI